LNHNLYLFIYFFLYLVKSYRSLIPLILPVIFMYVLMCRQETTHSLNRGFLIASGIYSRDGLNAAL